MKSIIEDQEISLEGAFNVRDIGGYPTFQGEMTRRNMFYRADSLSNLSYQDIAVLKELGITLQIDLRSSYEVLKSPSKLQGVVGIKYINISLFDNIHSSDLEDFPESLSQLYCDMLDNYKDRFKDIIQFMLNHQGGCVFNCTAGKDRTGVVAMLILSLVGVIEEVILQDYSISESRIIPMIHLQKAKWNQKEQPFPAYIFASKIEEMETTMAYIKDKYKTTKNYLKDCGLTETEIRQFKKRFTN